MLMQLFDEHGAEVWAYPKPEAKTSRLVGLGVTLALVVGSLGLYAARRNKAAEPAVSVTSDPVAYVAAPQPSAAAAAAPPERPPMRSRLWIPETDEETQELLDAARMAMLGSDQLEHQLRATWRRVWGGTYPEARQPGDHRSVGRAIALTHAAVMIASREFDQEIGVFEELAPKFREIRKSRPSAAKASPAQAPTHAAVAEREPNSASEPDPEPEMSEVPCPGHFYEVREGQELTGEAGIATGALLMAGLEAGCAQGWSRAETEAKAMELAHHPQAQAIYAKLIADCENNAGKLEPLRPGTRLWLPPLPRGALLGSSDDYSS